VKALSPKK